MIDVVCAVIVEDNKVLCVQRSEKMPLPFTWEFPGGKVEPEERETDAIVREIQEELGVRVKTLLRLQPSLFTYSHADVQLVPFLCVIDDGTLHLKEHRDAKYLTIGELDRLDWADADIPIVLEVKNRGEELLSIVLKAVRTN